MIIGFAGCARSGKDTCAKLTKDILHPFFSDVEIMAFADPIKRIAMDVYAFTPDQVYGSAKELPDSRYPRAGKDPLSPREALQKLGTEWGRSCYPGTWVDMAMRAIDKKPASSLTLITDVRFCNEAFAIRMRRGCVVRLNRTKPIMSHASEQEVWSSDMTALITYDLDNCGSIEDTAHRLRARWTLEGIIPAQSRFNCE